MTAIASNQYRLTLDLDTWPNFQWNLNQNAMVLIEEIAFEYATYKMEDICLGQNILNWFGPDETNGFLG